MSFQTAIKVSSVTNVSHAANARWIALNADLIAEDDADTFVDLEEDIEGDVLSMLEGMDALIAEAESAAELYAQDVVDTYSDLAEEVDGDVLRLIEDITTDSTMADLAVSLLSVAA